jgi:thiol-disulfide isomerase/thioredoxin
MHHCLVAAVEKYDLEKNYVAVKTVLLNTDKLNCHICDEILEGLEDIDDECDVYGIHLVKIQDPQLAKRYSIKTFPALVYFRNGNPLLYEGKFYISQLLGTACLFC